MAVCGIILFGFYIIAVIGVIFFPVAIPFNWPNNLSWQETLYNLTRANLSPLYFLDFTNHPLRMPWLIRDFGLNAILTIPFGFGYGYYRRPGWLKLVFSALLTGLTLEGVQQIIILVTGTLYRTVDINDVILNALGVIIGFAIFLIIKSAFHKLKKNKSYQTVEKQD